MATRNRAIEYGKIKSWFPEVRENPSLIELDRYLNEYGKHVERSATIIREMLRILGTSGGNSLSFAVDLSNFHWSSKIETLKNELENRYAKLNPTPKILEWELTKEQISRLFIRSNSAAYGGLTLYFQQATEKDLNNNELTIISKQNDHYLIAANPNIQRVSYIFIRAENENGVPSEFQSAAILHEPMATVSREINDDTLYTNYYFGGENFNSTIYDWDLPFKKEITREDVAKNENSIKELLEQSGTIQKNMQNNSDMPLTGRYHLRIVGKIPDKVKLIFSYINY